jgi:hypothetical protein
VWLGCIGYNPDPIDYPDEINGEIDPANRDGINYFAFPDPAAWAIWESYYLNGEPYQLGGVAHDIYIAGLTDLGTGLGPADDYAIACGAGGGPSPTTGNGYSGPGGTQESADLGCPNGYYFDPVTEACLPLCGEDGQWCAGALAPPSGGGGTGSCAIGHPPPCAKGEALNIGGCCVPDPPVPRAVSTPLTIPTPTASISVTACGCLEEGLESEEIEL